MTPRQKLVAKIKAILAKTIDNGATEEEATAALEKAQQIMSAHDIALSEVEALAEAKAEGANIWSAGTVDFYGIKKSLSYGIEQYTQTRCWISSCTGVTFCGLKSDTELAAWMLQHLSQFVVEQLNGYKRQRRKAGFGTPRMAASSFVRGCTTRITERLLEMVRQRPTGTALVVCRNALITEKLAEEGIRIGKARARSLTVDGMSFAHGQRAGNKASFGRPTEGASVTRGRLAAR